MTNEHAVRALSEAWPHLTDEMRREANRRHWMYAHDWLEVLKWAQEQEEWHVPLMLAKLTGGKS